MFQFALPHGERRMTTSPTAPRRSFNSRSRMGSDGITDRASNSMLGFNSRSRMGSDVG